jgi:hypothetical protein
MANKIRRRNAANTAWVDVIDGDNYVTTTTYGSDKTAIEGRLDTAEEDIGDLQTDVGTLQTDMVAVQLASNPTGTFISGGWTTAPAGYLLMDGVLITDGALTHADLAAMFPSWVSGDDLTPPNANGLVILGSSGTPGTTGGSMTHTLATTNLPSHSHVMTHGHSAGTLTVPLHNHSINHTHATFTTASGGSHNHGLYDSSTSAGTGSFNKTNTAAGTLFATSTGNHTHSISVPAFTGTSGDQAATTITGSTADFTGSTETTGDGTAVDHTPAHIKARVAVKT